MLGSRRCADGTPTGNFFRKIRNFYFPSDPNHFITFAIPAHTEGRFAIVTNVGQGQGMRWTRAAPKTRALACGRRSRVVLTPRRWRQVGDDASHHADDGGKQARSPGRARNKLLKPSRAGMPGDPGATVVTNARAYHSTRAAAGATGTRHSPLPPWAKVLPNDSGAIARRECGGVYLRAPDAAQRHKRVHARLSTRYVLRRDVLLIPGPCSASLTCGSRLCSAS